MIELEEWIRATRFPGRPWLLVGKGPTFAKVHDLALGEYNLFGLNHVPAALPVDVAHVIDLDVVEALGEQLLDRARWVVMPRIPHVQQSPSLLRLEDFVAANAVLRRLDREGRLVWYNASPSPPVGDSKPVTVQYFSSEAALGILARMGVSAVRSVGIDGGRSYSPGFSRSSLLANGQPSFDLQFERLEAIVAEHGLDFRPIVEPIRVFVGLDESQVLAAKVLEHSIRSHTERPVRVVHMKNLSVPKPLDPANRPRTGFSFSRFLIPELAGRSGRAIYLDADMQVFADIGELWDYPFDGARVLCTDQPDVPERWKDNPWFRPGPQMSVMLLDCDRLDWRIDEIVEGLDSNRYTYQQLMFEMCVVAPDEMRASLPPEWNHLERYEAGRTHLLHYTVVPTQPWKNDENPLRDIWHRGLQAALDDGAVTVADIEDAIRRGHVKSSLATMRPSDVEQRSRPAADLEIEALRARLDDLEGGLAKRIRIRGEVWAKRAAYAAERAAPAVEPLAERMRAIARRSP